MSRPLLTTKLHPPAAGPTRLVRERLATVLTDAPAGSVIAVIAPAGYGKTTLAASWLDDPTRPSAWLSLESADDDPARFWEYVTASLSTVDAAATAGARLALEGDRPEPDALVVALLNGLAAREGPPISLVLDDVHLVEHPDVMRTLGRFLSEGAASLQTVLLARSDPPLPLSRLRGRGRLVEIRQAELRFTEAEVGAYLASLELAVPERSITGLADRTEGWAASLQLAALSLERLPAAERPGFVEEFSGNDRFVVDYLVDEVLAAQPEATHDFLLATSVLDRMCEAACDAVCSAAGLEGPFPTLADLEGRGLFVLPLDRERRWYRYHHLFSELLRIRAATRFDLDTLRTAAAEWFAREADVEEAMDYALAAGRSDLAEAILDERFPMMLGQGRLAAVRRATDRLPRDRVEASLGLCIALGYAESLSGDLERGQRWATLAARLEAEDHEKETAVGHLAILEGFRAAAASEPHAVSAAMARAREHFIGWDFFSFILPVIEMQEAFVALALGDTAEAVRSGRSAWRRGLESGNRHAGATGLQTAAFAGIVQGRFEEVIAEIGEALSRRSNGSPLTAVAQGYVEVQRAGAALRLGRLDEAERLLGAARTLVETARIANLDALTTAEEIRLDLARGRLADAARRGSALLVVLDAARVVLLNAPALESIALHGMVAGGAGVDAAAWYRQLEGTIADRGWEVLSLITLARMLLDEGDARRCEQTAAEAARRAEAHGSWAWFDEAIVLRALALERLRDGKAVEVLERAFPGIVERDHRLPVLIAGTDLLPVLSRALARSPGTVDAGWVAALAAAIAERDAPAPALLSDRELEILTFLAAGLSNPQIADRLFLSVGTVKKHTHNIYGKLEVRRRTEAVARARELGIVE